MGLTDLAEHQATALGLALAAVAGLCLAVRTLWKSLQGARGEIKQLYTMNRELVMAAFLAAAGRRERHEGNQEGLSALEAGQAVEGNTHASRPGQDSGRA